MLYPLSYRRFAPAYRWGPALHEGGTRAARRPRPRSGSRRLGSDEELGPLLGQLPPCPFVLVSGTSLIVCPPTSSRARMSRKADAAVSVIWSMTLTPSRRASRRGLCVYPHERMGHLDEPCRIAGIDGMCRVVANEHGTTGYESGLSGLPSRVDGGTGRSASRIHRARDRPDRCGTKPRGRGPAEPRASVPVGAPVPPASLGVDPSCRGRKLDRRRLSGPAMSDQRGSGRSRFQCRTTEQSHTESLTGATAKRPIAR
jgi:hypothetical protein